MSTMKIKAYYWGQNDEQHRLVQHCVFGVSDQPLFHKWPPNANDPLIFGRSKWPPNFNSVYNMHQSWSYVILHWNLQNFNHLTYYFKNSKFSKYKLFWEEIVTFFKMLVNFFQNDPLILEWPPNENDPLNFKNRKWPPKGFWQKPP